MQVSQVMTQPVITVRLDTTVEEIARLLITHRISAVPVVDQEQHLLGMVSEEDLFLKEKGIPFSAVKLPVLFNQWVEPTRLQEIMAGARHHTAADIMNTELEAVDSQEHIGHVAWLMVQGKLKRVPVVQEGKLVGIVTRADVLKLLASEPHSPSTAGT